MKKLIVSLILVIGLIGNCYAADQIISIKIPDAKVVKALEGFLTIYPNNETVSEEDLTPLYTNKEWVTEKVRRIIVRDIRRGLQMKVNQEAQVEKDDGVAVID